MAQEDKKRELMATKGQEPIETEIKKRPWRWIGHTLRKEDGNIAKVALEWNPQGKLKRGRPTQSWRTRMSELKAKNITWTECKRTARNSTRWKALVEDLCSTLERRGQRGERAGPFPMTESVAQTHESNLVLS